MASFADLGLPQPLVDALASQNIYDAFEIQAATIADLLAGHDLCGRAPTGSGKTLAFGLPLITHLLEAPAPEPHRPHALVLVPTRELAEQIVRDFEGLTDDVSFVSVYGGVGYGKQTKALKRGVDCLVACPGRLEDLIERGDVDLSAVDYVVLDEADRMADMGFLPSVHRLLDQTNAERQTVLFSATLDGDVAEVRARHQNDPRVHEVGPATPDIRKAHHVFWKTDKMERNPLTAEVIKAAWPTVVFVRTRHGADRLARQLNKLDLETVAIHGDMSQNKRQRALDAFTAHRAHAMIATDVAARGIHVDGVRSVVHYDLPQDNKDYVHRSGRTARAGEQGTVVAFVQPDQNKKAHRLIKMLDIDAKVGDFSDEDLETMRAEPPEVKEMVVTEIEDPADRQSSTGGRRNSGGGSGGGRDGRRDRGRNHRGNRDRRDDRRGGQRDRDFRRDDDRRSDRRDGRRDDRGRDDRGRNDRGRNAHRDRDGARNRADRWDREDRRGGDRSDRRDRRDTDNRRFGDDRRGGPKGGRRDGRDRDRYSERGGSRSRQDTPGHRQSHRGRTDGDRRYGSRDRYDSRDGYRSDRNDRGADQRGPGQRNGSKPGARRDRYNDQPGGDRRSTRRRDDRSSTSGPNGRKGRNDDSRSARSTRGSAHDASGPKRPNRKARRAHLQPGYEGPKPEHS